MFVFVLKLYAYFCVRQSHETRIMSVCIVLNECRNPAKNNLSIFVQETNGSCQMLFAVCLCLRVWKVRLFFIVVSFICVCLSAVFFCVFVYSMVFFSVVLKIQFYSYWIFQIEKRFLCTTFNRHITQVTNFAHIVYSFVVESSKWMKFNWHIFGNDIETWILSVSLIQWNGTLNKHTSLRP